MNVFISYRRDDTRDFAGRLADRLRAVPDIRKLFIDVEAIGAGEDFVARIGEALAKDPVCLIVIGRDWAGRREDGRSRIREEGDFVRLEVASALASGLRVIPVLTNGAAMPAPADLPDDLARLPSLNALSVRHEYFNSDVEILIGAILEAKQPGAFARFLGRHPFLAGALRVTLGVLLALVALVALMAVHGAVAERSLEESLGGRGPVWLVIGLTVIAGAATALLTRRKWRPKV